MVTFRVKFLDLISLLSYSVSATQSIVPVSETQLEPYIYCNLTLWIEIIWMVIGDY